MLPEILKTTAVLALVLGLIFALAWLARRVVPSARNGASAEGWRLLGTKALGPRRHVYLLEVGSRIIVIGSTDKNLSALAEITDSEERERVLESLGRQRKPLASFQDLLRKAEKR